MYCIYVILNANVNLYKNVINPSSVSFSARCGKIEAEYLFTAHPFKTRGSLSSARAKARHVIAWQPPPL